MSTPFGMLSVPAGLPPAGAAAALAGRADDGALALADGAGLLEVDEAVAGGDHAAAAALAAGLALGALRRAGAAAVGAVLADGEVHLAADAEDRLLEVDFEVEAQVGAALRGVRVA